MLKRRPKKYDVNLKLSVDDNAYMTVACVVGGTMICTGLNMLGDIITTGISKISNNKSVAPAPAPKVEPKKDSAETK